MSHRQLVLDIVLIALGLLAFLFAAESQMTSEMNAITLCVAVALTCIGVFKTTQDVLPR